MDAEHEYLVGKPKSCVKSLDVLFKLDDGIKLPVHSQVVAVHSNVIADMHGDGPLSAASAEQMAELPLTDCTKGTAETLMNVIYSIDAIRHINQENGMAIARVAYKLDMKEVVRLCDEVISGASSTPDGKLPPSFKGKSLQSLLSTMESAERFGMKKTMACCEHAIAQDTSGRLTIYNVRVNAHGASAHTVSCFERVCKLRDSPISAWTAEDFLRQPINQHHA